MSSSAPASTGASTVSAVRLVAEREVSAQLRTKGFWVAFGLFVVGLLAATVLPGRLAGDGSVTVAAAGPAAAEAVAGSALEVRPAADQAAAEQLVRDEEVDAAVVPDPAADPTGVRVVALAEAPDEVVAALSLSPPVDLLEEPDTSDGVRFAVALAFALAFLTFSFFGMAIAQSVVTEKQTRIVEILVATVPIRAILAGKIAGHSLLVFGQVAVLAVLAPLGLRLGDQTSLLTLLGPSLGWFVPFFILGFVLLASLWAVAGALVSRQEDLGTSTTPVTMLVMVPYFAVVFLYDNPLAMTVLSYVPFSASVAMPVRLFVGDAQPWEPLVSLALLALTLVGSVLVASRLYAGSLLHTAGRVRFSQAWSR